MGQEEPEGSHGRPFVLPERFNFASGHGRGPRLHRATKDGDSEHNEQSL